VIQRGSDRVGSAWINHGAVGVAEGLRGPCDRGVQIVCDPVQPSDGGSEMRANTVPLFSTVWMSVDQSSERSCGVAWRGHSATISPTQHDDCQWVQDV
jgi:hypothetical protein